MYPKSVAIVFFPQGLKSEFEIAMVNEPSVFEPLKVCELKYCLKELFNPKEPTNSLDLICFALKSTFEHISLDSKLLLHPSSLTLVFTKSFLLMQTAVRLTEIF